MSLDQFFEVPQFHLDQNRKEELLLAEIGELTKQHQAGSVSYRDIIRAIQFSDQATSLADYPPLPVSLFKTHLLSSVPDDEVFKILTSSGTTGQQVSRVVLDRETAQLQAKALGSVMKRILGPRRLPMIVIDTPNVVKDRTMFSARGAGVLGMAQFGRNHFYALDDDMDLQIEGIKKFANEHRGERILLFGFTFMVWQYFVERLQKEGIDLDLNNSVLVHSGGWKKLQDKAVTNEVFKQTVGQVVGTKDIHNFYGMVEQVGGVFLEGDDGFLHPPNFSEVIIRNPETWEESEFGQPGIIETISVLPRSYPGHVLLTEDIGIVHGIGDAKAGWGGKQLEVIGRIPKAEIRGCSDTHAFDGSAVA